MRGVTGIANTAACHIDLACIERQESALRRARFGASEKGLAVLNDVDASIGRVPGRIHAIRADGGSSLQPLSSWMGSVLPAVTKHVNVAVAALRSEDVIALPSDTIYGLAADACAAKAIQRIYHIKDRDLDKPLAVCVADIDDVARYATVDHLPSGLLSGLFPGPVTLILPRGKESPLHESLNPGTTSIGIRIPDAYFIRAVAREFRGALALTSANISGREGTVDVGEFKELWNKCAAVFDGGPLRGGRAGSTIIDLTKSGCYSVVRKGSALEPTLSILCDKYKLQESNV